MKKIVLLSVAAIMLFVSAHAQYSMTSHPESSDQLAAMFPSNYPIGQFLGTYAGSGMPAFTSTEIKVVLTKAGVAVIDFSKITYATIALQYEDTSGMHYDVHTVSLFPDGFGGMKTNLYFTPIAPLDGHMAIMLYADLKSGADTVFDAIRCIGTVSGGTTASLPALSKTTFVKKLLYCGPFGASDRIMTSMPQFSQIVGTFDINATLDLDISQLEMQMSGEINGYIPQFINPRIVDESGATIANAFGAIGSSMGVSTSLHLSAGNHRKLYVLSDIMSATPGDNVSVELVGGCGIAGPFATVISNTPVIFPNPATDRFMVNLAGEWTMTLANSAGQVVKNQSGNGAMEITRDGLASGMYILTASKPDGTSTHEKIIFR
jgi:hypothetical protein